MAPDRKLSDVEAARETLKDAVTLIESISQYCSDIDELLGMLRLGIENDGQIKLLMAMVKVSK